MDRVLRTLETLFFYRVETQIFKGKEYYRYPGERYFTKGVKKLHRVVWEYYNGKIPKGYHIHHIDENTANNDISNLEMLSCSEHLRLHAEEHKRDEAWLEKARKNMQKANEAACKWHSSEEGRKWHSEHAKNQNIQPKEFVCDWCGKKFMAKPNGHNHFCSNNCKTRFRYHEGFDNEVRICKECGKEFVANKYAKTEFCCRHCGGDVGCKKTKSQTIIPFIMSISTHFQKCNNKQMWVGNFSSLFCIFAAE